MLTPEHLEMLELLSTKEYWSQEEFVEFFHRYMADIFHSVAEEYMFEENTSELRKDMTNLMNQIFQPYMKNGIIVITNGRLKQKIIGFKVVEDSAGNSVKLLPILDEEYAALHIP